MSKTTINEVEINGEIYVLKAAQSSEPKNSDIKILVLQRGWVMIGRYSKEGETITLENAQVIRQWGTTKGLGELALEGKKGSTKLDKAGHVEIHVLTVVATINCDDKLWDSELN